MLLLLLTGCGGGGSSSAVSAGATTPASTQTSPPPPVATLNTAALTLDGGPAALQAGGGGFSAFNTPYVSITLCAPGAPGDCQTIDHVILDTGSVGLRILATALNDSFLSTLPLETDASRNAVGECYQYVNSYAFGSVRTADFSIAGEAVGAMPMQVISDSGAFATPPSSCSDGGGTQIQTLQDLGANGILGVGTTTTDCGSYCTADGASAAAIYYDCPAAGCGAIIGRAANTSAPFQQLPNPVAAFLSDNNGVIITLPAVAQGGVPTLTGLVTFGIGTQADNALSATHVLPVTTSADRLGPGVLTATYKGSPLTQSFLDSGSTDYEFIDTSLNPCTEADLIAYYCPVTPMLLSPTLTAEDGSTASAAFELYSPLNVPDSSSVAPGLGVNPTLIVPPLPFANSFDFGLPFFFGRSIYTAIEGRPAGGVQGPYVAF